MRGRSCFSVVVWGALFMLLAAQSAFGAGFGLYEGSARGNALGGAMVGRADDPSALFFNPAGITQLPGIQFMAGATAILPSMDVTTTNMYDGRTITTSSEDNVWVPPHLYATYQYSDRVWFGLGVFSPFGLGTEFDSSWPGRYNNYNAVIQTLTVNPNVALKLNDRLSIAAGLELMWFDLKLENFIDGNVLLARAGVPGVKVNDPSTNLFDIDQTLKGDSYGYGFNLAVHYRLLDWVSLGLSYRSQVKQHLEGDAKFDKKPSSALPLPPPLAPIWDASFQNTDVSGSVILPDMLFMGVAFRPIERWSFEVGAVWNRWSTYDALTIVYDDPLVPGTSPVVSRIKDWNDTWRIQFGVEYNALPWLDLRAGYVYDQEPVTDEHVDYLVPANDSHLFNFGPGLKFGPWSLDISYTYIYITDRDVAERQISEGILASEYRNGNAHLFGASIGYKF